MRTFSLQHSTLMFGTKLEGFGEGSAFDVEPTGDKWVTTVGVDGSVARAYTGNKSFKFKIRLLQTSPHNAILSAIFMADESTVGGLVVPIMYKDQAGLDLFSCDSAWIIKPPKMTRGSKIETTEWEGETGPGKLFHGGN